MESILYTQLNPDDCNIQDVEFERGINRFMERYMTSFPLSLLEKDYDRWELQPLGTCEVESEFPADSDDCHEVFFVIDIYGERHEFADECDAEYFAQEQNEEEEQNRLGFPWAHNCCFMPEDNIRDEELRAAGFTIALYTDSDGDQVRLCGIDSCGYSFMGAHFSKLCAIVYHRWGRAVQTVDGLRLIEFPKTGGE
jgi:hypothetical protein